jgi:hypothetical protein
MLFGSTNMCEKPLMFKPQFACRCSVPGFVDSFPALWTDTVQPLHESEMLTNPQSCFKLQMSSKIGDSQLEGMPFRK